MITDNQARKLMKYLQEKKALGIAATKSGMDEKTARKYRDIGKLPSELRQRKYELGELVKIHSMKCGNWSNLFWKTIPALKQKPYSSIYRGSILGDFKTDRFVHFKER